MTILVAVEDVTHTCFPRPCVSISDESQLPWGQKSVQLGPGCAGEASSSQKAAGCVIHDFIFKMIKNNTTDNCKC